MHFNGLVVCGYDNNPSDNSLGGYNLNFSFFPTFLSSSRHLLDYTRKKELPRWRRIGRGPFILGGTWFICETKDWQLDKKTKQQQKRINKKADENNRCVRWIRSRHVSSITKCASTIVKSNVTGQASDYSQSARRDASRSRQMGKKKIPIGRPLEANRLLCDGRSL